MYGREARRPYYSEGACLIVVFTAYRREVHRPRYSDYRLNDLWTRMDGDPLV